MSKTDKGDLLGAKATQPVALAIEAHGSQMYLVNNEVLQALYGESAPVRLEVSLTRGLLFPATACAEAKLALFQEFPELTYEQFEQFVESDQFYEFVYGQICQDALLCGGDKFVNLKRNRELLEKVRAILVDEDLLTEECSLPEVFRRYFPEAVLFKVWFPGRGAPERVEQE